MNKKLLFVLVILLALFITVVYLLVPRTLTVSSAAIVKCNGNGAARVLGRNDVWEKVLPGRRVGDFEIGVRTNGFREVGLWVRRGEDTVPGRLAVLSLGNMDSIGLQWNSSLDAGAGPVHRIREYRLALGIRKMMDTVLLRMKSYLERSENIYGIEMRDSMSGISLLLQIRRNTAAYPNTADIYERVHTLRKYIADQGAKETDYPMMHVSEKTDTGYESIVGIPVDRQLKGRGQIEPKRYVPWKVMTGKVIGGAYMAEQGMVYLQQYVTDHQKPAMGLPFQSLVTERDREADTTRWVTWVVQAVP